MSSLYWQETFARRCLSLRLTLVSAVCLFWCGVTFAQHVFGDVSRIERGGLGSRWQLTGSWRCRWKGALLGVAASEQSFLSRPRSASVFRRASGRVAEYFHGMGPKSTLAFSLPTCTRKCWTSRDGTGSGANESCRSLPPRSVLTQPSLGTAGRSAEFQRNGTSRRDCRSSNRRRLRRLPPEKADKIAERVKSLEMAGVSCPTGGLTTIPLALGGTHGRSAYSHLHPTSGGAPCGGQRQRKCSLGRCSRCWPARLKNEETRADVKCPVSTSVGPRPVCLEGLGQ